MIEYPTKSNSPKKIGCSIHVLCQKSKKVGFLVQSNPIIEKKFKNQF
jgi:hypothetical protein